MSQPPENEAARPQQGEDPEAARAAHLLEVGLSSHPSTPARPSPPPTPTELERLFPDLEILDLLGQGGMGVVYKARQRKLDRLVAIKILPRELGEDPAFAARFGREARTLARLDHPHIVRIHEFGDVEGLYYLLMEFVDGASLRQVMDAGRLGPAESLAIVPQVCDALQYAHDQGVVHRDVKPENILLDERGRVKMADFGLAKLTEGDRPDPSLTGTRQVMGTWQYMAPEQYRSPQGVDHRADIFSLGVVFYEMLTGDLPVGRFQQPSEAQDLDERIDAIVMRALERERDQRYQQADDVREDVEHLGDERVRSRPPSHANAHAPAPAPIGAASDTAPGPRRGGLWPLMTALTLFPLGGVLAFVTWHMAHFSWGESYNDAWEWSGAVITVMWLFTFVLALVGGWVAVHHGRRARVWILAGSLAAAAGFGIAAFWVQAGNSVKRHQMNVLYERVLAEDQARRLQHDPEHRRQQEMLHWNDGAVPKVSNAPPHLARDLAYGVLETWSTWVDEMRDGDLEAGDASSLYAADDTSTIFHMDEEVFDECRAQNTLGLGMVPARTIGVAVHRLKVETIVLDDLERTASVTAAMREPKHEIVVTFGVRRVDQDWRLMLGEVQIEATESP